MLRPGNAFEELAENHLDGRIMASTAVAADSLFIRTDKALYRVTDLPETDS